MLQYAYVNRNNAEVDLTGFGKANGATVYLTKKNALIKAVSTEQVANRKNVIVDGVCENFELTDREPFAASEAFTAKNALYTRTMANEWGTLVLPYAVASNDRVKYYELIATRMDGGDSYMTFSLVDELPANTPCAFRRMDAEEQVNFEAVEVTIEPVTTKTTETETGLTGWAADGYYEKVTVEEPEELGRTYYISNNTFMNATKSLEILPFRATFVNSEVNGVNRFLIDFSDWTNSVESASLRASLSVFAETGMLRMVAGADVRYAVYTLGGMLVEQGMLQAGEEHLLKLASGIYIVNGLKVQVR